MGQLVLGPCERLVTRREVRDLSPTQLKDFIDALHALAKNGRLAAFATAHAADADRVHGSALFLPYHRALLAEFERELQRVRPAVALPYWDWSRDARAPHRSRVLGPEYFGGSRADGCVPDGPFAEWDPRTGEATRDRQRCLWRGYDPATGLPAFHSTSLLGELVRGRYDGYDDFRRALEGAPHAVPHDKIGGVMGTMESPLDPLFWLHHSMVEKLWGDFQLQRGGANAGHGIPP